MKILQVIQRKQLRGAEIFACQISSEFQRLGNTVDVAYLFETGSLHDYPFDLNFIPISANARRRLFDFAAYRRIADIVRNNKYDVVQANAADTLKYLVFSRLLFKWKTPIVFRNANKISDFIKSPLHRAFNRYLLSKVSFVISVSESCRLDAISICPRLEKKSVTIYVGTYDLGFQKNSIRENRVPRIINISTFVREKNHVFLLEIFTEFVNRYREAELYLVGDGPERGNIEAYIRQHNIGDKVKVLGYRKDALELLCSSDVLLMPSRIEGLPGVILEATASGIPVVASDVGGIPELIENNVTGVALSGFVSSEFTAALERVLTDSSFRNHLVENARAKFLSGFTVPFLSQRFLDVYEGIVQNRLN